MWNLKFNIVFRCIAFVCFLLRYGATCNEFEKIGKINFNLCWVHCTYRHFRLRNCISVEHNHCFHFCKNIFPIHEHLFSASNSYSSVIMELHNSEGFFHFQFSFSRHDDMTSYPVSYTVIHILLNIGITKNRFFVLLC